MGRFVDLTVTVHLCLRPHSLSRYVIVLLFDICIIVVLPMLVCILIIKLFNFMVFILLFAIFITVFNFRSRFDIWLTVLHFVHRTQYHSPFYTWFLHQYLHSDHHCLIHFFFTSHIKIFHTFLFFGVWLITLSTPLAYGIVADIYYI